MLKKLFLILIAATGLISSAAAFELSWFTVERPAYDFQEEITYNFFQGYTSASLEAAGSFTVSNKELEGQLRFRKNDYRTDLVTRFIYHPLRWNHVLLGPEFTYHFTDYNNIYEHDFLIGLNILGIINDKVKVGGWADYFEKTSVITSDIVLNDYSMSGGVFCYWDFIKNHTLFARIGTTDFYKYQLLLTAFTDLAVYRTFAGFISLGFDFYTIWTDFITVGAIPSECGIKIVTEFKL